MIGTLFVPIYVISSWLRQSCWVACYLGVSLVSVIARLRVLQEEQLACNR